MKHISGYFSELLTSLMLLSLLTQPAGGQDTLRTYGPRIAVDLARVAYLFTDPVRVGAEFSVDAEVFPDIYPVIEAGYTSVSETRELYSYSADGPYARLGADYNLLAVKDRSIHHSITAGFRYGVSRFSHRAGHILISSDYWGDYVLDSYSNTVTGHWLELVGAVRTELAPNFFLGWSVRYKILLNPEMDELVKPQLVPGYGLGTAERAFGFTYQVMYKIPLVKK
jgi:hypothetical protein